MVNIDDYILIFSCILTLFLFYSVYKIISITHKLRTKDTINICKNVNDNIREEIYDDHYLMIQNEIEILKSSLEELKKDIELNNSLKASRNYGVMQKISDIDINNASTVLDVSHHLVKGYSPQYVIPVASFSDKVVTSSERSAVRKIAEEKISKGIKSRSKLRGRNK